MRQARDSRTGTKDSPTLIRLLRCSTRSPPRVLLKHGVDVKIENAPLPSPDGPSKSHLSRCLLKTILIVENDPTEMRAAASIAEALGVTKRHSFSTVRDTLAFLQVCLDGGSPFPDALIVDLDMGQESGFELLRHWRTTALQSVPIIVWSALGADHYQQMCKIFRIDHFVGKWEGNDALRKCLIECSDGRSR